MKKLFLIISTSLLLLFFTGCTSSSDTIFLNDRITELENKIKTGSDNSKESTSSKFKEFEKKNRKIYQDLRADYASLSQKIYNLKDEFHILTGKVEESLHILKIQKKSQKSVSKKSLKLEKNLFKISKQLKKIEQFIGLKSKKTNFKPEKAEESNLSEKDLYNLAMKYFEQGKISQSKDKFKNFIIKYPDSNNADNAQFWISEIYYKEKWYEKAILEYQKVIEHYPKGNKVPAAYLKQGYAFNKIGQKAKAKLILNKLIKKFPKAPEAKKKRKKLTRIK